MSRRQEDRTDDVEVRARGLWAVWFVAGAVVALAALPAYIGNQVGEAQSHINDVLQPASNLSSRLSLLNSRQMARFEGFVLSSDGSLRRAYVGAIAEEDSVYAQLNVLARDLSLEVRERLAELSAASTRWHIDNQRVLALNDAAARTAALPASRSAYTSLQRATDLFDRAIQSEVQAGRRRMAQARTQQSRITLALALLALATTFMVGRVGSRLKGLTREAQARRADALRARREIDALLEATGDGVLGIDLEGRCMSLNRAGAKLLGYTEEEVRGRDFHETFHGERDDGTARPRDESPVVAALAQGEAADSTGVDVLRRRDGSPLPVKWALRPLIDGTELRGSVLTFTDMTEIQRTEAALREAIRQREDMVSIVSHDLRNPLGVVFGATDILLELPLDEQGRKRQAEIIGRAATRMSNLIEDLLDVSRIQDGVLVVRRALEDVGEVVAEAVTLFRDQADQQGVDLSVDVRGSPLRARLDRDRILQALTNLLDNAIRLTPEGGHVTLVADMHDDHVAIEVADTGPGIPPDALEHVFDRYWQRKDGSGGTAGLGLTIVKGVVDAHGGEVRVRSTVGEGTAFTLLFPVAISEAAREAVG